ncbi:MAG: bifunctional sugar-1-phosphate nucleotidylyltransferase/acetyltransferase [Thermoplasmata archaeon]
MKAVILAAGEGSRLWPFTYSKPKVMIPVANKPILEYVVRSLVSNGINDIIMVVGYKKERIMTYFEDGRSFGARIDYVVQKKQLGTAHALLAASKRTKGAFIVLPGDNVIDSQVVDDLLSAGECPCALITESEIPSKYGVVQIQEGKVADIMEKPEEMIGNLISTGIYMMGSEAFSRIRSQSRKGVHDLTSIVRDIAASDDVVAVHTSGKWIDAVYPWDLLRVNETVLQDVGEMKSGKIEKNVMVNGPVLMGEESLLRSGTYILGPVVIGSGCEVGPGAVIYPSTSIGDNVRISANSVIEESVIMSDATIGPGSHLSHCVVGEGAFLRSRFSSSSSVSAIEVEGEFHKVSNIGAFLGEDVLCEDGVVALPGSIVGAKSRVGAMKVLRGNIPDRSIVV